MIVQYRTRLTDAAHILISPPALRRRFFCAAEGSATEPDEGTLRLTGNLTNVVTAMVGGAAITLDLNGHRISFDRESSRNAIVVYAGASLTLTDSKPASEGEVSGGARVEALLAGDQRFRRDGAPGSQLRRDGRRALRRLCPNRLLLRRLVRGSERRG